MSTSFTLTREAMAASILRKLGVIASGESASVNDLAIIYEAMDLRLKELHVLGLFWRKLTTTEATFTITANTAVAATGLTDILFPVSMHVTINNNDTDIKIIDPISYSTIELKTQQGEPLYAMRRDNSFVFWPVPTANRTAKLTYEKIIDDTQVSTAPDVEVSMMKSLITLVSSDLADSFGIDERKIIRLLKEAEMAERKIRNLSAPRVDLLPVQLDNFEYRTSNIKTDWK